MDLHVGDTIVHCERIAARKLLFRKQQAQLGRHCNRFQSLPKKG